MSEHQVVNTFFFKFDFVFKHLTAKQLLDSNWGTMVSEATAVPI